jgi:hypothetical protein
MKKLSKICTLLIFAGLILGICKGKLALIAESDGQPVEIYPLFAAMLPAADQKTLTEGIPVRSAEELSRLLEDFLS